MRQSTLQMSFQCKLYPPGHVLERLNTLFCSAVGLVIADGRVCRDRFVLPGLPNPRLENYHSRLLVRLEVHVLLNAIDILHTLLNQLGRVTFFGSALSNAGVAKQRSGLRFAHDRYWDPIPWICVSTFHETKVCANRWHARRFS